MSKTIFDPIGVDYITFACLNRNYWADKLSRLGFVRVSSAYPDNERKGMPMRLGELRILLVDPETHGKQISYFVGIRGSMQVLSVDIKIDSYLGALSELRAKGIGHESMLKDGVDDPFGKAWKIRLSTPSESAFSWVLSERIKHADSYNGHDEALVSTGVDHFAVAVNDLGMWQDFYHGLGFKTIYVPKQEIKGKYSGMDTVAVQRGGWTIALVQGIDMDRPSQVSIYVRAHGDHSIQHAAVGFDDLKGAVSRLMNQGAQFRLRRIRENPDAPAVLDDVLHEGEDHSGKLLQCFTKPLKKRLIRGGFAGGFFFELIQRLRKSERPKKSGKAAFDDGTVIGLYESIEIEEEKDDRTLILPN